MSSDKKRNYYDLKEMENIKNAKIQLFYTKKPKF